ncbi:MAG: Fatty acid metabolism regulator protein [Syntrophorhabdaceae bacterium PtaU1.Bin034]|nr:MAG: Fatty acid metabolism regulator protein [Syntrophorhabdaceae bacterium PtaU1.Bin034]
MNKKKLKKQHIIQAAIAVFGKSSFQDASICEIAKNAGVAEGTIYQYFKNKEDLFFAIPLERTKVFCAELDVHLKGITGATEKLKKLVWYYLYFFKTNPDYARSLMLEMRVSRRFTKSRTYKGLRMFSNQVLQILQEGQEEGAIRKDCDIYLSRQLLLGTLEHIVTRWLLKGEKYDVTERHEQVIDLVLRGIGSPGPWNGKCAGAEQTGSE